MACGERQLFIYYRVAERELAAACAAVTLAQQALRARHAGLLTQLLRRPAASAEGERTVMEIYAVDARVSPAGVGEALQAEIEAELAAALHPWRAARMRHVEVFVNRC